MSDEAAKPWAGTGSPQMAPDSSSDPSTPVLASATAAGIHPDEVEQLRQALRSRDLIGQAKGMIQLIAQCREDTAWAVLVRVSQFSNRKVANLAPELIEGLTGRQELDPQLASTLRAAIAHYRGSRN